MPPDPSARPALRGRLETMVERFARALRADQVVAPRAVATLDDLEPVPATRSGERLLAPGRVTRHPDEPRLAKVGLSGDVVLDETAAAETAARLRGQRGKLGLASKIRRYLLAPDRHKVARVAGYLASRRRARHAPPFGAPTPCSDKAWALVPGVNLWRDEDGLWRCTDDGAIYETHLTTHAVRYPSQVGADLYTNSCAAAIFRFVWERTGDRAWEEALAASGRYLAAQRLHPRQRLESDHREFDFGPVRLAFGAEAAAPFAGWVDYDPINVYGLRWFNEALSGADDAAARGRRALILRTLERAQTRDGLLPDNFSGNAVDSTDLTYHQYALAMLCLGNARLRDARADRVIEKALAFSVGQMLATGEATHYGRGANNIYHLASLVAALCYGAGVLGLAVGEPLERALGRLEAFQDEDGRWPTAMNRADRAGMIGWHGGNGQYGALSAFLLAEGARLLATAGAEPVKPLAGPPDGRAARHLVLRGGGVELALTGGGGAIPWSQGLHRSGFAGMTALVVGGRNLLLTNDELTLWGGAPVLVADVQNQTVLDRRRLVRDDRGAVLEIAGPRLRGRFAYTLEADGIGVSAHTTGPAGHALALVGRCRIVAATPAAVTVVSDAGFSVMVETSGPVETELVPVPVNPQGPGTLVRLTGREPSLTLRYRFTVDASA